MQSVAFGGRIGDWETPVDMDFNTDVRTRTVINTLDCLYGSLQDAGRFDFFLKRFAEITSADSAAVFDFDLSRADAMRFTISAYDDATHARFMELFPAYDDKLWWQRGERQMTTGSVINGIDLASEHEIKATRYYRELLQPLDIAQIVVEALALPRTAEVTDIQIRPARKP